jgi:hypothetical protein
VAEPGWEAGAEAPPVLVGVLAVAVRVPAVEVRVFPPVVGATAAVLLEAAVPRQTARLALRSVPGSLAADRA